MFESIVNGFQSLMAITNSNPFFGGVLGAGLVGGVLISLKQLPLKIWRLICHQCLVQLDLLEHGESWSGLSVQFSNFQIWVQSVPSASKFTRVFTTAGLRSSPTLSSGNGFHLFWFNYRLYWYKQSELPSTGSERMKHKISIYTFGRSTAPINELFEEFKFKHLEENKNKPGCYNLNDGTWVRVAEPSTRTFDTVFMNEETKIELFEAVDGFLAGRERHRKFGVPYRLGICLEGPTGTGKTSIFKALAVKYNRPVYILPIGRLNGMGIVNALISAKGGFVIMEDIDSNDNMRARASDSIDKDRSSIPPPAKEDKKITNSDESFWDNLLDGGISEMLNGLDGIIETEDVILLSSTNDLEKLDKALFRTGRFDVTITVDHLTRETVNNTLSRFFDDESTTSIIASRIPGSSLMKEIIVSKSKEEAISRLNKKFTNT